MKKKSKKNRNKKKKYLNENYYLNKDEMRFYGIFLFLVQIKILIVHTRKKKINK